ncbi:high mobility group box domain-containing protein, partial [Chytriomyces sp. MP71]
MVAKVWCTVEKIVGQGMAPPTKKPSENRVLRPPNAFILYRSEMHPKLAAENKGRSSRDWSGIVGQMWKSEDPAVKAKYHEMARGRLLEHKQKYPDYKYAPGRKEAK